MNDKTDRKSMVERDKNHFSEDFLKHHLGLMIRLCFISAFLFIGWALVVSLIDDTRFEVWPIRIGISIYFAAVAWFGSRTRGLALKTLEWWFSFGASLAIAYASYVSWQMGFHPTWVAGSLLIIFGGLNFMTYRGPTLLYIGTIVIAGLASFANHDAVHLMSPNSVLLNFLTGIVLGSFSSAQRNRFLFQVLRSERRQSMILSNMSEAVLLYDSQGKIEAGNPAAYRILGATIRDTDSAGLDIFDRPLFDSEGRQVPKAELPSHLVLQSGGPVLNSELRFRAPAGEWVWVAISAVPIFDEGDLPLSRVLVTFRDVTEMRQALDTINEQRETLFNTSKLYALGEMSAGVAHEINNPLAVILGIAHLLKRKIVKGPVPAEELGDSIDKILKTVDRIARIVNSMRRLSRQNANDDKSIVDVSSVISDIQEISAAGLRHQNIELRIKCGSDLKILARTGEIGQVLLNLVNNARDAILEKPEKWISVEAIDRGLHGIEISVTDSGKGIPPQIRQKIMQPFFTTKDVGKGTGLGLSLVRSIVIQHDGDFYLDETCANTRFVMTLPRAEAAEVQSA